jgi:hypothetical protein
LRIIRRCTFFFVTRVAGSAPDFAVFFAAGAFGWTFFFSAIVVTSSRLPGCAGILPAREAEVV